MPGTLLHSPADIARSLIVSLGLGSHPPTPPASASAWPVYAFSIPKYPDEAICVYDTGGRQHGRDMLTKRMAEIHGVMIRVRAVKSRDGYVKARAIAVALDQQSTMVHVNVPDSENGNGSYLVQTVLRTSDVAALGEERPEGTDKSEQSSSKRMVFSINALISVKTYGT